MTNSLAKGTFYLTFSSIIFLVSGYLINILLGRFLGPENYGLYGIVISLVTIINLAQNSGLPFTVSKYVSSESDKEEAIYRTGFYLQIASTIFASILFFFLSGVIANLLKDPGLASYLQLAALIFPFYGTFALLTGYYNGLHKFGTQALLHITYSILKIITIIILAYYFRLFGVIIGFIISPLIALLIKFHIPKRTNINFSYKKLIAFSIPLIGVAIFANVLQSIDLFFVKGITHSDKLAGFYTANQNVAEIPYFALTALASVLFPSISKHISQNLHHEAKKLISKSLRFSLLILIPGILLISATSATLLTFLFSSAYLPGATSLSILVIGSGFFTLFFIFVTIINSSGHPTKSSFLAGIGVIISSLLCLFLIPSFGLIGAALATTIAAFIVMVGAAVIVYRKFGVLFSLKSSIKIITASLLIYFLAWIIVVPNLLLPLLYLFLFALYSGLLFLLKEITREDIKMVSDMLPGWMKRKNNS